MDEHTSLRSIAASLATIPTLFNSIAPASSLSTTNWSRFTTGGARFPHAPPPPSATLSQSVYHSQNFSGPQDTRIPVLPDTNPYRSQQTTGTAASAAGHPFFQAGGGYKKSAGRKIGGSGKSGRYGGNNRSGGSEGNGWNGNVRKPWGGSPNRGGRGGRGGWRGGNSGRAK